MSVCQICKKEEAVNACDSCKKKLCGDSSCGSDTVDGYLCGEYTQWGCGRKYTTCDACLDDKAIHEVDLNFCADCGNGQCDKCPLTECKKCGDGYCDECTGEHECD
jgi:hypothetical protein